MDVSPELMLHQFSYDLPRSAIAQTPLEDRAEARLLDTRDMTDHVYTELPLLLEPGDLVVVNSTKVRAARLATTRKDSGGKVEVLLLGPRQEGTWDALVRPARRLSAGIVLMVDGGEIELVNDPEQGRVQAWLRPPGGSDVESWIAQAGAMPLPPYISESLSDSDRYQTVFAQQVGSAAAPTAGLHFTQKVLNDLETRGVGIAELELRVGIDTFRPISVDRLVDHTMHSERYDVPAQTAHKIAETRASGGRVVAVGTTVCRTLETASVGGGLVEAGSGASTLFVTPGYRLKTVDLMLTNFHVPESTLIVMVAAIMGDQWSDAYHAALQRGYRFLSFGDTMLIAPTPSSRRA
jgi:S-adenosylmethionine:tRNA ribosyltransferase-isomerase